MKRRLMRPSIVDGTEHQGDSSTQRIELHPQNGPPSVFLAVLRKASRFKITLAVIVAMVALGGVGAYVAHREFLGAETFDAAFYANAATTNPDADFSYDAYAATLKAYVDANGMVDYRGLKDDHKKLDEFLLAMARVDRSAYDEWSEQARVAFWINAYNALTLKAIIDHYPIKAGLISGLAYPKNSIRQIPGAWDKIQWLVMGQKLTLNQIEHGILRGEDKGLSETYGRFNEPRIHVALVCAARGCPQLRNEPFVGERLDEQLSDQSRGFVTDASKFRIDLPTGQAGRDAGKVYLSSIFKWFGGDFVKTYLPEAGFGEHGKSERAVLHYASEYLPDEDAAYLRNGDYAIEYLDYDWSLNEQQNSEH